MNCLLIIKQISFSILRVNNKKMICLHAMISFHEIKIVEIDYSNEKKIEIQWIYKLHARLILFKLIWNFSLLILKFKQFNLAFVNWKKKKYFSAVVINESKKISFVIALFRLFNIANKFLILNRINRLFKRVKKIFWLKIFSFFVLKKFSLIIFRIWVEKLTIK